MDVSQDCHTEWGKSEREKLLLYINAYMWNLEKWHKWSCSENRNRGSDIENKCMDTKEEGGGWDQLGSKLEGNPKQRKYMYVYNWFTLLYRRN